MMLEADREAVFKSLLRARGHPIGRSLYRRSAPLLREAAGSSPGYIAPVNIQRFKYGEGS